MFEIPNTRHMQESQLEDLVYKLKKDRKEGKGAMVFLGAGASQTANIPLAKKIIEDVLKDYGDSPKIQRLVRAGQMDYYSIMNCLDPSDRRKIFAEYIKNAKINVTHIYLAQLLCEGYVDYIFTVNFDNLTQRALSLYNMFPAIYDIAMLKGLTTTTFNHPGVVFLHGQHAGFYQLNTKDEFKEAQTIIRASFQRVCDRPWIVVGYSGDDAVFDYISEYTSFSNGLYWVCYKDELPSDKAQKELFDNHSKNASIIKGYDADSFFLKLHPKLGLEHPDIISKPFTHLRKLQESIIDIEGDDYEYVKNRFNSRKKWVDDAIDVFENGRGFEIGKSESVVDIKIDNLLNELINVILKDDFEKIIYYENELKNYNNIETVKNVLSNAYNDWGLYYSDLGDKHDGTDAIKFHNQASEKFKKAIEINPYLDIAYMNWGNTLAKMALKRLGNIDELYKEAFQKYESAARINPNNIDIEYNCAFAQINYANALVKNNKTEANNLCNTALNKINNIIYSQSNSSNIHFALGLIYSIKGDILNNEESEKMYEDARKKYREVIKLDPNHYDAYINIGHDYAKIAKRQEGDVEVFNFYKKAAENYKQAIIINPEAHFPWEAWSTVLLEFSHKRKGQEKAEILQDALEKSKRTLELGGRLYNYACVNALLENIEEAFKYLEKSLSKNEITFEHVENDIDWDGLRDDERYIKLRDKYTQL